MQKSLQEKLTYKESRYQNQFIPYYSFSQYIDNQEIKRYFVIDLVEHPELESIIFPNFSKFQDCIFAEVYYTQRNLPLYLLFVSDKKRYDVIYNLKYTLKFFVTEKELEDLVTKSSSDLYVPMNDKSFVYDNQEYVLNKLNYIYGGNGSGKSQMLRTIAKEYDEVLYSIEDDAISPNLCDESSMRKYYELLTNKKECYSSSDKMFQKISILLARYQEYQNRLLLMDDIFWGRLDPYNRVKLIEVLNDYAIESENSIITCGVQENVGNTIKRRCYKPNIIELPY